MSQFAVSPATATDLPAIAKIVQNAFEDSPNTISYWMLPRENEAAVYEWRLRRAEENFHNDPTSSFIKCVDTATDKIVAFAIWEKPYSFMTQEQKAKQQQDGREMRSNDNDLPKGTNAALLHDLDAQTARMRAKYVNREEDYVLRALATLPQYQGKGCGSALLQWSLEKVDADGRRVFLEATPQGHSLYAKFGWKDVDEMVFDLNAFGFNGHVQKIICMMRDATK
ncbi:hypothetical protein JMJ35_008413 [Cladonia borealis]|uniref:N-acetyltransferase domain-containing protein n=1 Tax=Cladonia borealis TaxID=184061 RepID=A0AA39QTP4_9LECA|nr:hypothetical protein JMJ35_008413 [Cladonia borealis]